MFYISERCKSQNLHFGGGQEKGFRPGTENTGSIVAMGLGAEIAKRDLERI